jgi:WhiB family redox-sensing transcriptional regulator
VGAAVSAAPPVSAAPAVAAASAAPAPAVAAAAVEALPGVSADGIAWRESAACLGCAPSLFFPRDECEDAVPKAVCARCSVRVDCLVDAILTREHEGVRGGLNERERRSLSRKAKRRARQAGCSTLVALMTCIGEHSAFAAVPNGTFLSRDAVRR